MNSNNLDEKPLLVYVVNCLRYWGISYITEDILKKSKRNEASVSSEMARLLFDLSLLHIFDYQYFLNELEICFNDQDNNQMIQIALAHLAQIECPILIQNHEGEVGLDLKQTRVILLLCGWLMAVSNFFSKNIPKLLKVKQVNIYKANQCDFDSSKKINQKKILNKFEGNSEIERISYLCKMLKMKKYKVQCLVQKKKKMIKNVNQHLSKIYGGLKIEDLITNRDKSQIANKELQVLEMVDNQKQNMKYRHYFWIWLDVKSNLNQQKIISSEYEHLKSTYGEYQKLQYTSFVNLEVKIDIQYLHKQIAKVNRIF